MESRVYGNERCFGVFPSGRCLWRSDNAVFTNGSTEEMDRGNGYTLIPNRRVPKAKPAAASAWEEWQLIRVSTDPNKWNDAFNAFVAAREKAAVEEWNRSIFPLNVIHSSGDLSVNVKIKDGNRVVVNTYEKPVPSPKPDAGRAEGTKCPACGKVAHSTAKHGQFFCSDAECSRRWLSFEPIPAPKPRRAPEVVAEEFQLSLMPGVLRHVDGRVWICPDNTPEKIREWIAAAVRADRGEG